jgi:undecaprenyl diphosphate synthase
VTFAREISRRGAALLVLRDVQSPQFPAELVVFRTRQGKGIKVNFLVNYGWEWDLNGLKEGDLRSADVSRLDLIVRWGGGTRLSGFLPVQSVYADIFVIKALWPDFHRQHLEAALSWLGKQDRTLGGLMTVHRIHSRSVSAFWTLMLSAKMSRKRLRLQGV